MNLALIGQAKAICQRFAVTGRNISALDWRAMKFTDRAIVHFLTSSSTTGSVWLSFDNAQSEMYTSPMRDEFIGKSSVAPAKQRHCKGEGK